MIKATEKKLMFAVGALVVVGLAGWYLQRDSETAPEPVAEMPAPLPVPQPIVRDEPVSTTTDRVAPEIEKMELPALGESDAPAREAAGQLASKLAAWLTPAEQVRKWVVAVDQAAEGALLEKNRPLAYPMSAFKVADNDAEADTRSYHPMTSNYGRTDELIGALTSIPPARAAAYYQSWRPLFEEAYKELGKSGSFDTRLQMAIERVLAVKPLAGTPTLARPKILYRYADPKLEGASDIEKLLWRMGPDNSAKLQAWLTEVRQAL